VAAVNLGIHYYESKQVEDFFGPIVMDDDDDDDDDTNNDSFKTQQPKYRKRVLVLPFDSLKIIEHRQPGSITDMESFQPLLDRNKQPTITMEAKELVSILHAAASDPTISSLYATFGEGMRFPVGTAHVEEIRNAVRIFNESHRVHRDPNVKHEPLFAMMRNGDPKPSYAFGYGYDWNEYFLASAFSYVHLQGRGNLHLFGCVAQNTFFGGMLDKYGIKAHVFRHGQYKNAPSFLTEKKYSSAHLENVKSMTSSLNNTIRTCIETSRPMNFDNVMWQSIFDYGSLTSSNSEEIGLVDFTPPVDPLHSLLGFNSRKEAEKRKKKQKKKESLSQSSVNEGVSGEKAGDLSEEENTVSMLGLHESFSKFNATHEVSLVKYKQMLNKNAKLESRRKQLNNTLQKLSETSTATSMILSSLGFEFDGAPSKREKVAVVTVDGNINSALSYDIIRSLRQIKRDKHVKCMVLRVNSGGGSVVSSEAILEEMKLLNKPVICSMSNAAASGGYYIAMNSEKIFAQPTTLTGSIGVFGVKLDASKWAKSYGVRSDCYPHGSHAAAMNPLTPLTTGTKENIARIVLDYYDYFKSIVATRRFLSDEQVEEVAQGRVWTGEQAKEVGLVDALGGLDRAISYAKAAHTNSDEVEIEHWPRSSFRLEDLPKLISGQPSSDVDFAQALLAVTMGLEDNVKSGSVEQLLKNLTELKFAEKPHFMLTIDEKTALDLIMDGE